MSGTANPPILYGDSRGTVAKEDWNDWVKQINTNVVDTTGAYTLTITDGVLTCSGSFQVTLPTAVGITNKVYHIKNIGTGVITVSGANAETIDGEVSQDTDEKYENIMLISDGANWNIL